MYQRPELDEVEIYGVLCNARRREILVELWAEPGALTLRELSERIAATEAGTDPAPRSLRGSVYNALHQTHLPKMDELGLVAYDGDRKVVRVRPRAERLERYMDVTTPAGVTWGEYYRALGIVGLFATVTTIATAPLIDPLVPATAFLAAFALSTLYQLSAGRIGVRGRVERFCDRLFGS